MDLQGNIEKFTLADIFQLIAAGRKSGTLGIQRADSIIMVYFEAGEIVYGYGPRETYYLGRLLVDRGKITGEQLEDAIATQARAENTKRLGAIMMDKGFIDRVDLEAVVRDQVEELLFSLLGWRDGSFKFYEGQFPTKEEVKVSLSVENVILEGLRRLDEAHMIQESLPDLNQVYRISNSAAGRTRAVTMKASEWNAMALVDGYRNLNEICERSPYSRHETLNRVAQLKLAGIIEPAERKPIPTASNPKLDQMISGLSQMFEAYLSEKQTGPSPANNRITQVLVGEKTGEPD